MGLDAVRTALTLRARANGYGVNPVLDAIYAYAGVRGEEASVARGLFAGVLPRILAEADRVSAMLRDDPAAPHLFEGYMRSLDELSNLAAVFLGEAAYAGICARIGALTLASRDAKPTWDMLRESRRDEEARAQKAAAARSGPPKKNTRATPADDDEYYF